MTTMMGTPPLIARPLPTAALLAGLLAAVTAAAGSAPARAQDGAAAAAEGARVGGGPRIAAVVNEDVITTQDLEARLNLVTATSGAPPDPEVRRRLTQQVLRGFIDEKLQLQEAKRLSLQVTEPEIDQALTVLAQRNRLGLEAFKAALAERGIDQRALRSQIRGQIAWAKVVNRELRPKVTVSGDQVERAFKEATATGGAAGDVELLVGEILLPVDSAADEARVLREAQGLAATLRGGADFAALARQVSIAASAENGGDLGWVRPAVILPELRQKLLALPEGGVSDPITSPAGVHLFKLRQRRVPGAAAAAATPEKRLVVTRVELAQLLLPLAPDAKPPQVKAAEARARELKPTMKGCADIETYARRTASEGSGKLGWLDLKDMPAPLRQLVSALPPRQASEPFRGPLGVQILMVCDRQGREETVAAAPPPPPPPPPSKDQTRQRLEEEQLERLATRYLRELRKDAYIDLRLSA